MNHAEEREGDIKHSLADISAAQSAFGYKVIADLAFGLEQTIEWAKESVACGLASARLASGLLRLAYSALRTYSLWRFLGRLRMPRT